MLHRFLSTALTLLISSAALAQTYPSRPVRIIAPFPPGNAADVAARAMTDRLGQRLGQPIVVENRSGGAGIIGTEAAAKAPADGYTLLLSSISPVALLPAVYKKLPYDPKKDLVPISQIGIVAMLLVASPSLAANSVGELVQHVKANPGKLNYAHLGPGTISHLAMETMRASAGLAIVGIPYKGSGTALAEMMSGEVALMVDGITSANAQVRAGKVKALAVLTTRRSPFAPAVPTIGEAGLQQMHELDITSWVGLFAPAGTPRPIIERWHKEIVEVTQAADVRERLGNVNVEALASESPEKFAEYHTRELAKWERVAKGAGVFQSQ